MESRLLFLVTITVSLLIMTNAERSEWTTPGHSVLNLNGKMFTLSLYGGGITFYPPYYYPLWHSTTYAPRTTTTPYTSSPWPSNTAPSTTTWRTTRWPTTTPWRTTGWTTNSKITATWRYTTNKPTTTPWRTTRWPTTPWTTASPTKGVSVCLRYITDYLRSSSPSIFTLSPSSTPLQLTVQYSGIYQLTFSGYYNLPLTPILKFLPISEPNIWTSICLTVDSRKNVAQVFRGSNMSIRKMLPYKYVWSGEPVIDFSGFDGQLTDVQMWDYPLLYKEIWSYMIGGSYGSYQGSVLTWSNIGYNLRGNTLMEDTYERQAKEPMRRRGAGHYLKGRKKFRIMGESEDKKMV